MTLRETADTLITWVESCRTNEQLSLLDKIIDSHLIIRFKSDKGLPHEVTRVLVALQERSKNLPVADSFIPLNLN